MNEVAFQNPQHALLGSQHTMLLCLASDVMGLCTVLLMVDMFVFSCNLCFLAAPKASRQRHARGLSEIVSWRR
jgi:hypothetical protein